MGLLLNNDQGWAPATRISKAFFDDCISLIGEKKGYEELVQEIRDVVFFYSFTLDYREKNKISLLPLYETVVILLFSFDTMYEGRLEEHAIEIYRGSLLDLKEKLINYLFETKLNEPQ